MQGISQGTGKKTGSWYQVDVIFMISDLLVGALLLSATLISGITH